MRALLLLFPLAASAASFDCAKAVSRVEKAICSESELSTLDEHLGRFYFAARDRLAENASCIAADQRDWIRRRNACADSACLKKLYLERLAELAALQPGMNLPRSLELPRAPALVWAIATPEEMKGDPKAASKPFRVEGALGRGDDGIAVGSYALIGDMFLGGATATQLAVIMETGKAARFAARGFLRDDSRHFDNQHCVYLYRLP
jgi:uncharacterized protein